METIERILGHAIPIPPEPFIPESELRPLTEADFQRLFEEFCAAPVIMPPADYWTETTTETPAPLPVAKEFSATTARQPRRHRPTDQEKSISTLKAERFVTISAAAHRPAQLLSTRQNRQEKNRAGTQEILLGPGGCREVQKRRKDHQSPRC